MSSNTNIIVAPKMTASLAKAYEAYDALPKILKQALQDSMMNFSAPQILHYMKYGSPKNPKPHTVQMILDMMRKTNRDEYLHGMWKALSKPQTKEQEAVNIAAKYFK